MATADTIQAPLFNSNNQPDMGHGSTWDLHQLAGGTQDPRGMSSESSYTRRLVHLVVNLKL